MSTTGGVRRGGGIESFQIVNGSMTIMEGSIGTTVVPQVSAVDAPLLDVDAGASNLLVGFRVTAGATDDTIASQRLSLGAPAVKQSGYDSSITLNFSTSVTRLDVVGLMNGVATGNCINHSDTAAKALAEMTTFTFPTAVSRIVVSMTPAFTTGREAQIHVEGYSYA